MSIPTEAPNYEAIKTKQQKAWSSGDYSAIAARIPLVSERLADAADLRAGSRVLDVAGGNGNTALAAARCGAHVTSLDYVPELLERAAERARAERLPLELVEGDAERMPFDDAAFDAVISGVGVMFAPDQARAAAELLRVCRPGGTIALASWSPDGFIGELFRTTAATCRRRRASPRRCAGAPRTASRSCSAAASRTCAQRAAPTSSGSRRRRPSWTSSARTTGPR